MAHVLVVGAGLAGARVCTLLRAAGFDGRITLVGAEADPPYDRPPLTKDPGAEVDLRVAMGVDVWAAADEVRLGAPALRLRVQPDGLAVDLPGSSEQADAVVVATGAAPVEPAGWTGGPGVSLLHTRSQADALWAQVGPATRLVIVGGGWIGCEVAATAAMRGARVTLLEAADRLLAGRLPAAVAERIGQWLADAGVEVRLGTPAGDVLAAADGAGPCVLAPAPSAQAATGAGGAGPVAGRLPEALAADVVLVALGVRPATAWLAGSGIACSPAGAVLVDPWCRSSLPGVLAVGDAAARWSARAGRHLEGGHWSGAMEHPADLVPTLLQWLDPARPDGRAWWAAALPGAVPDPVPSLFSHVGDRVLQAVGEVGGPGEVRWDEDERGFVASVLAADGRLLGACGSGRPRDLVAARRLLRETGAAPAASALAMGA